MSGRGNGQTGKQFFWACVVDLRPITIKALVKVDLEYDWVVVRTLRDG